MMVQRYYRFAGLEFQIEMAEEILYRDERTLAPFAVQEVTTPHRFCFEFAEHLPEPEGSLITKQPNVRVYALDDREVRYIGGQDPHLRVEHADHEHYILARRNVYSDHIGAKTVLECIAVEHLIARNHGFVFHCSYIDRGGKAILFTAPSETGKSTQADLWAKYRGAEIINGDRAAVRLADGLLLAEGIPFAGSSQFCKNRSLPIEAIVYLGQAPKTTIRRLRGYEAFAKIWEGVSVNTWDRQDLELVSAVVQKLAQSVPIFHMPCTPDESAVTALEQALENR